MNYIHQQKDPWVQKILAETTLAGLPLGSKLSIKDMRSLIKLAPNVDPGSYMHNLTLSELKTIFSTQSLEINKRTLSNVCSAIGSLNYTSLLRGDSDDLLPLYYNTLFNEHIQKHLFFLEKYKTAGLDFSQPCLSGFSLDSELLTFFRNSETDQTIDSKTKAQISELKKKMTGDLATIKPFTRPAPCSSHSMGILNMKDICKMAAPLQFLLNESRKKAKPNVGSFVSTANQHCSLSALYQVNNGLLYGHITLEDLSNKSRHKIPLKGLRLQDYQEFLSKTLQEH